MFYFDFPRCNLAVMLICDVIVAGIDVEAQNVDWSIHVPLMLHVITLGLDHAKPLVHQHCKFIKEIHESLLALKLQVNK